MPINIEVITHQNYVRTTDSRSSIKQNLLPQAHSQTQTCNRHKEITPHSNSSIKNLHHHQMFIQKIQPTNNHTEQ
jgi:hypothetical protein